MAQNDFGTMNPATESGTQLATDLNNFRDALNSCHSGTSRPSYAVAGTIWMKTATTPWVVYMYDGTDDIQIGTVNATTNEFKPSSALRSDPQAVTITPATDADVTLTSAQELYGRLVLANGSWTAGHNIIVSNTERGYWVDNSAGSYNATIKTSAGTGIVILAGESSYVVCDGTNVINPIVSSSYTTPNSLIKSDYYSPAFTKTAAGAIAIKAGTKVPVAGKLVTFSIQTSITLPTLVAGTDYFIWVKDDGTIQATTSFSSSPAAGNWLLSGGFHYGLVAEGETVAGGSFATTGTGMIWTQADVDKIAGINEFSIWDLNWRSAQTDSLYRGQKGFYYNPRTNQWEAIYFTSSDPDSNGLSAAGTDIASGTVLPKIPAAVGGNGTTTYTALDWWTANEIARAYGCRLFREGQYNLAAFGVTENQSIGGASSTYPTTQRNPGYTGRFGMEQASGFQWIWGEDTGQYYDTTAWSFKNVNGGRGQIYTQGSYGLSRVILGGGRTNGADSGSRASFWGNYPWSSGWNVSLRAACDHLILM